MKEEYQEHQQARGDDVSNLTMMWGGQRVELDNSSLISDRQIHDNAYRRDAVQSATYYQQRRNSQLSQMSICSMCHKPFQLDDDDVSSSQDDEPKRFRTQAQKLAAQRVKARLAENRRKPSIQKGTARSRRDLAVKKPNSRNKTQARQSVGVTVCPLCSSKKEASFVNPAAASRARQQWAEMKSQRIPSTGPCTGENDNGIVNE